MGSPSARSMPRVGIVILLCLTAFGMVYLAYPLAAGFALIGPVRGDRPLRGEPPARGRASADLAWRHLDHGSARAARSAGWPLSRCSYS